MSGLPAPEFAEVIKVPWVVRQVTRMLSGGISRPVRRRRIRYAFLFIKASGSQFKQITVLIKYGASRPVIDKVFHFKATNESLA